MHDSSELRLTLFNAFRALPDDVIERLSALASVVTFEAGEKIIAKGDVGNALYVLQSGRAHATVPDSDGTLFHDEMQVGEVFGEMSLLTGETRSADITAVTDCSCLEFPFDSLRAVTREHPHVAQFLTTLVGKRLSRRDGIRRVGEYVIEEPLGGGGFSTVFRARNESTGELVALKMLKHELMWRADFAPRFRREARIIEKLVHPNIVRVIGVVEAYATLFIAMELIDGADLGQIISARGRLAPSEVRFVARRVVAALNHAHQQSVVHRDIKPANILLTSDGEVKLVDFGVAMGPDDGGRAASFYGTPHYAAPEHVLNLPMDGRTDLYMLGITTYELLTGVVPYASDTVQTTLGKHVREEIPDLPDTDGYPKDLRDFVHNATRRRPSHRFASCEVAGHFLDQHGQPDARPDTLGAEERTRIALSDTMTETDSDAPEAPAGQLDTPSSEPRGSRFSIRATERVREVDLTVLELTPDDYWPVG